ncbi:hypothetical protein EG832_05785 [bacterium]|nr:hypothetical protein [bacterium]
MLSDKKIVGITLPFETRQSPTPTSKYTDEELRAKHLRQQKQFETMLAAEEKPDPLMALAVKRLLTDPKWQGYRLLQRCLILTFSVSGL